MISLGVTVMFCHQLFPSYVVFKNILLTSALLELSSSPCKACIKVNRMFVCEQYGNIAMECCIIASKNIRFDCKRSQLRKIQLTFFLC